MINKSFVIVTCMMWLCISLAVCVGIFFTRSVNCLFFMLIPALINIHTLEEVDEEPAGRASELMTLNQCKAAIEILENFECSFPEDPDDPEGVYAQQVADALDLGITALDFVKEQLEKEN